MEHINKSQIPSKLLMANLTKFKSQLKQALANPSLSKEQRVALRNKLRTAGKSKNYLSQRPLNGAIEN